MANKDDSAIRVLVVDDSAILRRHIRNILQSQPDIKVCGNASNGIEALEELERLKPDVITLDVDMPQQGGLHTLPKIMQTRPTPVIMVSTLTSRGANVTFEALDLGAFDYIEKPSANYSQEMQRIHDSLIEKVRAAVGAKLPKPRKTQVSQSVFDAVPLKATNVKSLVKPLKAVKPALHLQQMCIVIGISTGGPPALHQTFEYLHPPTPPIVIVQHMPPGFTGPFAERLNQLSAIEIREAQHGDVLQPSTAYIGQGDRHLKLKNRANKIICCIEDSERVSSHRPSVDVLFKSAAEIYGKKLIGIIMTGMGRDGADGCKEVLKHGGKTLGQDQSTSVVYGMNKIAFEEGGVQKQFPLELLPSIISDFSK